MSWAIIRTDTLYATELQALRRVVELCRESNSTVYQAIRVPKRGREEEEEEETPTKKSKPLPPQGVTLYCVRYKRGMCITKEDGTELFSSKYKPTTRIFKVQLLMAILAMSLSDVSRPLTVYINSKYIVKNIKKMDSWAKDWDATSHTDKKVWMEIYNIYQRYLYPPTFVLMGEGGDFPVEQFQKALHIAKKFYIES